MEITRENILEQLANIQEPDLKKDIVSLNLIEDILINGNQIALKIKVVNPALHARNRMKEAVNFALKKKFGNDIQTEIQVLGLPKDEQAISGLSDFEMELILLLRKHFPQLSNKG